MAHEFKSADDTQRLLGPPPGHVGECSLCDRLRANPEAVVLLDEVEKGHKDVVQVSAACVAG